MFRAGAQLCFAEGEEKSFSGTWGGAYSTPFSWLWWDAAQQPMRGRAGCGWRQWATHPGDAFFNTEEGEMLG